MNQLNQYTSQRISTSRGIKLTAVADHLERIFRLSPSEDFNSFFPELDAYHEVSQKFALFLFKLKNHFNNEIDFLAFQKYIINELSLFVRVLQTKLVKAHISRHIELFHHSKLTNSKRDSRIVAEAQVLVLQGLIESIEKLDSLERWNRYKGLYILLLQTVLTVLEEQRTIGYLIYTNDFPRVDPMTNIPPYPGDNRDPVIRAAASSL